MNLWARNKNFEYLLLKMIFFLFVVKRNKTAYLFDSISVEYFISFFPSPPEDLMCVFPWLCTLSPVLGASHHCCQLSDSIQSVPCSNSKSFSLLFCLSLFILPCQFVRLIYFACFRLMPHFLPSQEKNHWLRYKYIITFARRVLSSICSTKKFFEIHIKT